MSGVSLAQVEYFSWLQMSDKVVDKNGNRQQIEWAYFRGEKRVAHYEIDGFFELDGKSIGIEFQGCFHHAHTCQNQLNANQRIQKQRDAKKHDYLKSKMTLWIIWECEWESQKGKSMKNLKSIIIFEKWICSL